MTVRVRTIRPAVVAVTAVVGALLLGGCAPTAAPRAVSAPDTTPVVSPAADDATTSGTGSTTMVTRVIDGDTFESPAR